VREILARMPQAIPYALEIPRATLTRAVGAAEAARLALVVTKSHLEGMTGARRPSPRAPTNGRAIARAH
jgi:hypothetical protein